jgi:hypothetical protein
LLRRTRAATLAVLAGRFELAGQEFPDLTQAGDLDLERNRCVAVGRLGVGALRRRRIDAMEFGRFDLPLGQSWARPWLLARVCFFCCLAIVALAILGEVDHWIASEPRADYFWFAMHNAIAQRINELPEQG